MGCNFIKKETPTQVIYYELWTIFKNTIFYKTLQVAAFLCYPAISQSLASLSIKININFWHYFADMYAFNFNWVFNHCFAIFHIFLRKDTHFCLLRTPTSLVVSKAVKLWQMVVQSRTLLFQIWKMLKMIQYFLSLVILQWTGGITIMGSNCFNRRSSKWWKY